MHECNTDLLLLRQIGNLIDDVLHSLLDLSFHFGLVFSHKPA